MKYRSIVWVASDPHSRPREPAGAGRRPGPPAAQRVELVADHLAPSRAPLLHGQHAGEVGDDVAVPAGLMAHPERGHVLTGRTDVPGTPAAEQAVVGVDQIYRVW